MNIKEMGVNIIEAVFPIIGNYKSNKKIHENLEKDNYRSVYTKDFDTISIETVKEKYQDTLYIKDKLEDKAKINVVATSLSVSLILNAYNMLNIISDKFHCQAIVWMVSIFFLAAVAYMIVAGILSIKLLVSENIIYTVSLESYTLDNNIIRSRYVICISKNNIQNIIRNNMVYTSYECIRNALVCLFIMLVVIIFPAP